MMVKPDEESPAMRSDAEDRTGVEDQMEVENATWDEYDTVVGWNRLVVGVLDERLPVDEDRAVGDRVETPRLGTEIQCESAEEDHEQYAPCLGRTPGGGERGSRVRFVRWCAGAGVGGHQDAVPRSTCRLASMEYLAQGLAISRFWLMGLPVNRHVP